MVVARLSTIAVTSSMDAAVSLTADEVMSADAASSSALVATPWIERVISSMAAAVWLTDDISASLSAVVAFTEAVISTIDVGDLVGG